MQKPHKQVSFASICKNTQKITQKNMQAIVPNNQAVDFQIPKNRDSDVAWKSNNMATVGFKKEHCV